MNPLKSCLWGIAAIATLLVQNVSGAVAPGASETSGTATTTGTVVRATVDSTKPMKVLLARLDEATINPVTAQFITKAIARAESEQALLILQLDTPGGLLSSTQQIVKAQLASKAPMVTYVAPDGSRAGSAGTFITMASHVAAMAPGTRIGAASVVSMTGGGRIRGKSDAGSTTASASETSATGTKIFGEVAEDGSADAMTNKIVKDTLAWAESIAKMRKRNADWFREAIETARSSTADDALKLGVIDLVAGDTSELLRKLDGREVQVAGGAVITLRTLGSVPETIDMSTRENILNVLATPEIALILLMLGLAGLFYEVTHPGLIIPGIAGAVSLLLAALGLQMLPTNYVAVLLIVTGIALIIAEVKIMSSGILGLLGVVALFFGSLTLIERPLPGFIGISTSVAVTVSGMTTLMLGTLVLLVARAHARQPAMGEESYAGRFAEAVTPLAPEGRVHFEGTLWNAVSAVPIAKGERVRVVAIEGLLLEVEPIGNEVEISATGRA